MAGTEASSVLGVDALNGGPMSTHVTSLYLIFGCWDAWLRVYVAARGVQRPPQLCWGSQCAAPLASQISSLEAQVSAKMAHLALLTTQNQALRRRASMLETVIQARDDQVLHLMAADCMHTSWFAVTTQDGMGASNALSLGRGGGGGGRPHA